jgi:GH15 family glucan-1,4-alpha-glucosidase
MMRGKTSHVLIEWISARWREKDETIWEFRTDRREYLYSRLMCWVALDRAIRLAWKTFVSRAHRSMA